ncbi:MAG: DUF2284 domain-containing protein, partial [Syntrophales bacterium]|nr:DUF2284 domain-containing protein [Syntrophales bacterium]
MGDGGVEELVGLLEGSGATAVRKVATADIVVDERVRLKCRVPLCDSYQRNLMCPPFVPTVAEFRTSLACYTRGLLIQFTTPVEEGGGEPPYADVFALANRLHEVGNLGEREAFRRGFRFAAGFI